MPETIASISTATNRMTATNRGYTPRGKVRESYVREWSMKANRTHTANGRRIVRSFQSTKFLFPERVLTEDRSAIGVYGVYQCLYTARKLVPGEISISKSSMANALVNIYVFFFSV